MIVLITLLTIGKYLSVGVGDVAEQVARDTDTTDVDIGNMWCVDSCATGHFADPEKHVERLQAPRELSCSLFRTR